MKKISVIMGVYNAEDTIGEALDSIINQTYTEWELVICDDASSDNTYSILEEYQKEYPEKIILFKNEINSKLSYSLNRCLEKATGHFIARMDADDKSILTRFEEQIKYLKNNRDIDLVGTAMQRFNDDGEHDIVYGKNKPNKFSLRNGTPFNHATIMTYKSVYKKLKGYTVSELTKRSQDIDLWFRFFNEGFKGTNLNKPLYLVRENDNAIKRRTARVRINSYKIRLKGYKQLNYPFHWYLELTFLFIVKLIFPSKLVKVYRNFQATFN